MRAALFALAVLPALSVVASAADGDRYRLEKSGDHFVRMDAQTGEMSICEERGGQLVCRLAADERSAFQSDIDRLEATVAGLESRVAKLEGSLAARLENALPSDAQVDQTMKVMERFLRGFMGIVKELESEQPSGTLPDKT